MMAMLVVTALLLQAGSGQSRRASQPNPPPYEGAWLVEVVDNIKVMPESRVTLTIRDNTISGNGPCNTYRGSFTVDEDSVIRVGQLLRTMKACDPARMSEETDFFAVLQSVVSFEMRPKEVIVLSTRDGRTIIARREPAASQHR